MRFRGVVTSAKGRLIEASRMQSQRSICGCVHSVATRLRDRRVTRARGSNGAQTRTLGCMAPGAAAALRLGRLSHSLRRPHDHFSSQPGARLPNRQLVVHVAIYRRTLSDLSALSRKNSSPTAYGKRYEAVVQIYLYAVVARTSGTNQGREDARAEWRWGTQLIE